MTVSTENFQFKSIKKNTHTHTLARTHAQKDHLRAIAITLVDCVKRAYVRIFQSNAVH